MSEKLDPCATSAHRGFMEHATATTFVPPERLSWAEICRRYPEQWVMLVEIERAEPFDPAIRSAVVVAHGTSRKAIGADTRGLVAERYGGGACRFTGEPRPLSPAVVHFRPLP